MQNQTDELLDQVINAAAAVQKAKDQCAFLERALQEITDRLDVAQDTHTRLAGEYVATLQHKISQEPRPRPVRKPAKRQAPSASSNPSTGGGGFDRLGRSGDASYEDYSYRV